MIFTSTYKFLYSINPYVYIMYGDVGAKYGPYPEFCLERWQSLREWDARINLADSGVEPFMLGDIMDPGSLAKIKLGYGHTKGDPELRKMILELYKADLSEDNVILTSGGAEANYISVLSLVKPGDDVVFQVPNYMQIEGLLYSIGARIRYLWLDPERDFRIDIDSIYSVIDRDVKAIILNNPNNPTGRMIGDEAYRAIIDLAEDYGVWIVVDEVYRGLEIDKPITPSIVEMYDKAISTNSLSKVFGAPGLRLGWVVSTVREAIDYMWGVKDYTSIAPPILSQEIAKNIIASIDRVIGRARGIVARNLQIFKKVFGGMESVSIVEPDAGAFLLLKIVSGESTLSMCERLYRDRGILVNPGECFMIPGYIRVSLGSADHQRYERDLEELKGFIEGSF